MTEATYTAEELETAFDYLDGLRESGETNMFGAGAYLERAFDYDRRRASAVLQLWMRTYSDDAPAVRASAAMCGAA
jgi:hypothetical protein